MRRRGWGHIDGTPRSQDFPLRPGGGEGQGEAWQGELRASPTSPGSLVLATLSALKGGEGILLVAALALFSATATAAPLTLRIQYAATSQFVPLIPLAPKALYRHYGKSYVVEPKFMIGAGPALTALMANELELAALNPQSMVNAVVTAKLDLRAIVQVLATDMPGYSGGQYWCHDPIKKAEDMRGKTIAINSRGSSPEAAARAYLARFGMKDTDYQFVEMPFSASLPALDSKRVDCAVLVSPWSIGMDKKPGYNKIFGLVDVLGPSESVVWTGKPDWIAKNRAALVDFVEDHIRFRRWALDPKTQPEAAKLAAQVDKQPVEKEIVDLHQRRQLASPGGLDQHRTVPEERERSARAGRDARHDRGRQVHRHLHPARGIGATQDQLRRTPMTKFVWGCLLALLAVAPAQAEPLKIRIQYATVGQFVPLIPVAPKELYRHYGKTYTVEPVFMAGAGPALTAFAAEGARPRRAQPAIARQRGRDGTAQRRRHRLRADDRRGGLQGRRILVPGPDQEDRRTSRGKTIAINTRGSTPEAAARILLGRHGMEPGKDYQPVEMPFNASLAALEAKKVDCAVMVSPWVNVVATRPGVNMVFKIGDVFGETKSTSWFGRPDWIKENRAALVDFVEDHIRMRHWCLDPKTQPEAVKLAAQIAKQSPEALNYLWTKNDNYHEPNGLMSVTRFQRNLDDLHKYGMISGPVDAKKHIDISIAEEAMARLKTQ